MSCITQNPTTLSALDALASNPDAAGINYYVAVDAGTPSITINFTNCVSVSVSPTPATAPGTTSVTFGTADHNTEFEIDFTVRTEDKAAGPMEDPTAKPKFKPVQTCP